MTEWKVLAVIFGTVFLAEIGDKTQLATLLFSAEGKVGPWQVFVASAAALLLACAIGVVAGQLVAKLVSPQLLKIVAGAGFLLIGAWTLYGGLRPTA
ncbi:TMEM165/GDT1 family protein [Lysobacter sp. CFH 32150]|uniref:TMEM165/GDT1 family protein n=1 Tax=Lysobacter sp. CFH 32150 TaxID=2927128 RepID=UPI001FA7C5E3|nr:TMEM165/GDT1 family protein [Lysobacter sp. CFH 32150]MCI4567659.1 TMEM165/GDT1 family protein [Lysobacter sp. CFH 32150]